MSYTSLLFDLDGTLIDSGEGIMSCAALALNRLGLPVPPPDELRTFVGPPLSESFPRFGCTPQQTEEAITIYRQRYNTVGKFEGFPYPGIAQLLSRLKDVGCRLYVATSKPEPVSVEILHHFGLADYFDRIAGAALDKSRGTKAEVIAYLLREVGPLERPLMIGDTAYDVLGAARHGIPTAGVDWGYGTVESMRQAGAAAIVSSVDELFALITAQGT